MAGAHGRPASGQQVSERARFEEVDLDLVMSVLPINQNGFPLVAPETVRHKIGSLVVKTEHNLSIRQFFAEKQEAETCHKCYNIKKLWVNTLFQGGLYMNCSVSMTMRRARAALGIAVTALAGAAGATERWGVWEMELQGPADGNP